MENNLDKIKTIEEYQRLKAHFTKMSETEKTTDFCQTMAELEPFDKTTFLSRETKKKLN